MYTPEKDKEHFIAIGQAVYENMDMIWQEEYFELFDNHIMPLVKDIGEEGDGLPTQASIDLYKHMYQLLLNNDDCWFQEDWFEFQDDVFDLLLELANSEGWTSELAQKFPLVYRTND